MTVSILRDAGENIDAAPVTPAAQANQPKPPADLIPVGEVAGMATCSSRHVYRMSDAGKMPKPIKLGSLVRWRRAEILAWIAEGCPPCRKGGR